MKVSKNIPTGLKRLINAIVKRSGNCENWLNGYNYNSNELSQIDIY